MIIKTYDYLNHHDKALIGFCLKADRTDTCYRCQSPAALFNAFGFVQINNPFVCHNVANVLAIDPDGAIGMPTFLPLQRYPEF
jgi:hypothetical protein